MGSVFVQLLKLPTEIDKFLNVNMKKVYLKMMPKNIRFQQNLLPGNICIVSLDIIRKGPMILKIGKSYEPCCFTHNSTVNITETI